MFRLFVLLVLPFSFNPEALAQTIGNVWHVPVNPQPIGVPSMRNPLRPFVNPPSAPSAGSITFYNGSFSLDGNQAGGFLHFRKRGNLAWNSLNLSFDTQNGNDKFWKTTLSLAGFKPGDVLEYFFEIQFTDRLTTYIYGTDTASQRGSSIATAQGAPFSVRLSVPWPGGGAAGYPSDPPSRIWHWKEEAVIGNGHITVMLDQNGSLYDIYYPSVGARQGVGTANEGYRGPEEFPNCPLDAQANGQMNVINGMGGIGVGTNIYWMKNQSGTDYTNVQQAYVTDNNVVRTTSRLRAPDYNIAVEQLDFCPVPSALPVVAAGGRTNYGVYLKRFLLVNLEASARTIDFYYDVNFNINGANVNDSMYFDTSSGRNTMVAFDNTYREVSGGGCGPDGNTIEYKPASYAGNYVKNISVFFGTAMKHITNGVTGGGAPADGSWRDHTQTDNQEGWLARHVTLQPGVTNEIDIIVVGSWDDAAGVTGTHDFWGRPIIDWFYTNSMATAQAATEAWWTDWLNSGVTVDFPDDNYDKLFKRSLLVSALHVDQASGSIIAGMHNGAYPFVWPRDMVYAAITFARTGHLKESEDAYRWLRDTAHRDNDPALGGEKGFFYQKYTTDGYQIWTSPQVDETASVPWGVHYHYQITGDRAFLSNHWDLVRSSARASSEDSGLDARLNFNDTFKLMDGNNAWEDSFGLFLYSNASVVRGLRDAANIAEALGQGTWSATFRNRATDIRENGIIPRLNARVEPSDISHLGMVVPYEVFEPTDPLMTNMIEWIHGRQTSGGFNDNLVETSGDNAGLLRRYNHSVSGAIDNYWNGGPWFLATAWYGEYFARWQDYVGGKDYITTNKLMLDKLITRLGPVGLGAEQIAGSVALQKYPGFWLQTAWPNVWESHSTMLDQMMMFLDYQPGESCAIAPKLPRGWTNMAFQNLVYRGQRFDVKVTESSTSTRAEIVKRTAGPLLFEACLRIPQGVTPVMRVFNNSYSVPAPPLQFSTNTGRVVISGSLNTTTGTNVLAVTFGNSDYDGDGLPDSWELLYALNPLDATGANGASGDLDGDGFTNLSEFLAGTDPASNSSLLRITSQADGGRTVTWSSAAGRTYRILTTTNVNQPFVPLSGVLASGGATTSFTDPNPAGARKYYRIELLAP